MSDIIWDNEKNIISKDSFELTIIHRQNGNSEEYQDIVKIIISKVYPNYEISGTKENRMNYASHTIRRHEKGKKVHDTKTM